MSGSDEKYKSRAKRFISRTPGNDHEEQTVEFIAELYRIEHNLIKLEKRADETRAILRTSGISDLREEHSKVSRDIYNLQKGINSPDDHLHKSIDANQNQIDNAAVSEILTQLGWEWFPRELDRIHSTHARVSRKIDSKRQQVLTNRIVALSLLAVVLSVIGILRPIIW